MPITEWLGETPWSERMIAIVDSILEHAPDRDAGRQDPVGQRRGQRRDDAGAQPAVLHDRQRARTSTWRAASPTTTCSATSIPTRDATRLRLRDHSCELISGLTEVYAACHFAAQGQGRGLPRADPRHARPHPRGRHQRARPDVRHGRTRRPARCSARRIGDNWGYNYNGFYTVYLLDGVERYREATRHALANLKPHYWKFPWQGWGSDGIADSVEGAINLFNREPDVDGVAEWIDANIARMLRHPETRRRDRGLARRRQLRPHRDHVGALEAAGRDDPAVARGCPARRGARRRMRCTWCVAADKPWTGQAGLRSPRATRRS